MSQNTIIEGFEITDLGLYYKKKKILILSDLHIGMEESFTRDGIMIPKFQLKDMTKRIRDIFTLRKIDKVIVLGDLKHEFGTISRQEWNDTFAVIDLFEELLPPPVEEKVILIRGNHDKILEPIVRKRSIKVQDYYFDEGNLFIHGNNDTLPDLDIKNIFIGHEHPAITISDSKRREKFKCFLKSGYKKGDAHYNLVVLPSFNTITEGTDITKEKILSPFLKKAENIEVFVVADKVYYFGDIEEL